MSITQLTRFKSSNSEEMIKTAKQEVYGKAQEGLAKDPEFAKLMTHMASFSELTGRNIAVGIDL